MAYFTCTAACNVTENPTKEGKIGQEAGTPKRLGESPGT